MAELSLLHTDFLEKYITVFTTLQWLSHVGCLPVDIEAFLTGPT